MKPRSQISWMYSSHMALQSSTMENFCASVHLCLLWEGHQCFNGAKETQQCWRTSNFPVSVLISDCVRADNVADSLTCFVVNAFADAASLVYNASQRSKQTWTLCRKNWGLACEPFTGTWTYLHVAVLGKLFTKTWTCLFWVTWSLATMLP